MLDGAETRRKALPDPVASRLSYSRGDARDVRRGEVYDAVISLFHVMSYQVADADLEAMFETAAAHLQPGGIFIFDFWYGPAVLTQRPEVRIKRLTSDAINVTRIAESVLRVNENIVDVNYALFIEVRSTGEIQEVRELHRMRYLFLPELARLRADKFRECSSLGWMTDAGLGSHTWAGMQTVARL